MFLGIGATLAIYINRLLKRVVLEGEVDYLYRNASINWYILGIYIVLMLGLVVAGYLIERRFGNVPGC